MCKLFRDLWKIMDKKLLFSVTKKDFDIQTFRCGGHGGQKVNKTSSGVRIIHRESGAVGESREERSQYQNKKLAFQRLVKDVKFKVWLNRKVFEITQNESLDDIVDREMSLENLKIEIKDEEGRWMKYEENNR